jgi:hypothetical protein
VAEDLFNAAFRRAGMRVPQLENTQLALMIYSLKKSLRQNEKEEDALNLVQK